MGSTTASGAMCSVGSGVWSSSLYRWVYTRGKFEELSCRKNHADMQQAVLQSRSALSLKIPVLFQLVELQLVYLCAMHAGAYARAVMMCPLTAYCHYQCRLQRAYGFTSLPVALANMTRLEVLDLMEANVFGGVLPPEYSAWTNLTTFRCDSHNGAADYSCMPAAPMAYL